MRRSVISATLTFALPLALLAGPGAFANDQLYKCVDPNGTLMLTDQPCAVVQAMPGDNDATVAPVQADLSAVPGNIGTVAEEQPRHGVAKEHYALPPTELDRTLGSRKLPTTSTPKIDIATLKAAKLNLELSEKTASR